MTIKQSVTLFIKAQKQKQLFQSNYTKNITNIQKSLAKGLNWIICLVIDHTISVSKYNPLAGSSYIKLPKELDHPRKV